MRPLLFALFLGLGVAAQAQLVRQANSTLVLPAELPASTSFVTQNALGSLTFTAPIDLASAPGVSNRLFVIERGLGIQVVNLDNMTKSTFMTLGTTTTSECGILSMAFHPNFNQNGYFYVFYSLNISSQLHQRVARFTANGTPGNYNAAISADISTVTANPATLAPLITQRDTAGNHNGGDMAFGPDGYLYFSAGDEGPQYDGGDNGRRIAKDFFGAIFRIDVDSKPGSLLPNSHDESSTATVGDSAITAGSYRIPPDNPFVALAGDGIGTASYNGFTFNKNAIRTEIYSVGYRNPWRISFDPLTGRLFVADVGQDHHEEVNIVTNGFNGSWSWYEGTHVHFRQGSVPGPPLPPLPQTPPAGAILNFPIYQYDHNNGATEPDSGNDAVITGNSITGGVVYRGDRLPELFGKYLFCDYNTGHIVALTEGANGTWTGVRIATDNGISGWGYDPRNDDALFCELTAGQVRRLARNGAPGGTAPPALLSGTGAFSNLATLTPQAGIVSYKPNVDFWSDYATKSRWFSIRNLVDTVGFSADGNWTLPTNMVWIKHFDIDLVRGNPATRRRLETRFLVKTANDVYGLSYQWNNIQSGAQTDATLVAEDGANLAITGTPNQTWRFPSRTECRICHTAVGGFALSFNTRQMNKEHLFGAQTLNQISALSGAGYFAAPVSGVNTLPAFAAGDDATASLEWRVRSYLAVNCVQCHQPGGASTGNWDARATTPTDLANLIGGLLVNDGGDPTNRWCIPDDLGRSMILKRLQGAGVARMPPLGSNERDLAAEALLTAWIDSNLEPTALPARKTFAQWQTTHFGSTTLPAAQPTANPDGDGQNNDLEWLLSESPLAINPPYLPLTSAAGVTFSLTFDHPANRSVLIETSTDFEAWSLWNVPDNAPLFPAATQERTVTGPLDAPNRFFRLRLSTP